MYAEEFAKRLTQLRINKDVSARDMSLSLGQSAGYINGLENGISLPSMNMFFCICEYFNITPMEFFDLENGNPKENNAILENLKYLTNEQLKNVSFTISEYKKLNHK